jgi:hypothetical protein
MTNTNNGSSERKLKELLIKGFYYLTEEYKNKNFINTGF